MNIVPVGPHLTMLLCKKKKEKGKEPPQLPAIVGNEDLVYLISSFLCSSDPSLLVCSRWNRSFSLVRAQRRWDHLTEHIKADGNECVWLYHKLCYIPGSTETNENSRRVPREGYLRIFRSNCNRTCDDAMREYRTNLRNDPVGNSRVDSRPDYYYRAKRELPDCIELVLPRPLPLAEAATFVNKIEYDKKPRLVNKFIGCIGDINRAQHPMADNSSKEGLWNLGYHEIKSVRDMTVSKCNPRPPLNGYGDDTTSFLQTCQARPADDPRWIKFGHLVGEDRCRLFLMKHLLPVMGPRPTGNAWDSSGRDPFDSRFDEQDKLPPTSA